MWRSHTRPMTCSGDSISRRSRSDSICCRVNIRAACRQRGRLPLMIVEGDWAEGRAVGLAVVAVGGHGGYLSRAQCALGPLARAQGDVHLAGTLVRELLPAGLATAPGDAPWFADALVMQRLAAA